VGLFESREGFDSFPCEKGSVNPHDPPTTLVILSEAKNTRILSEAASSSLRYVCVSENP
jgi:hypothetical protein